MEGEELKDKSLKNCPSHCFKENESGVYDMGKVACTKYHVKIRDEHHWPCGVCANICPVGEDRKMYRGTEVITEEGIRHCQSFGS